MKKNSLVKINPNDDKIYSFWLEIQSYLGELYAKQSDLDLIINKRHEIKTKPTLYKIIAFLVEMGELANELRFFKYWSIKPLSAKSVITEEYIDALHFLLSIGLDLQQKQEMDLELVAQISKQEHSDDLSDHFLNIYQDAITLSKQLDNKILCLKLHNILFIKFLLLAYLLDISPADLKSAYNYKHKINVTRQDNNY